MIAFRRIRTLQPCGTRYLSCSTAVKSGHNRWSKIKHDKAKVDVSITLCRALRASTNLVLQAGITRQRTAIAQELQLASRDHGPDIQSNPRLATIVAAAKKQGFPKASIENAIARGQGKSPSGAQLDSVTVEAMMPPAVAVIIECLTDSKLRLMSDLKHLVKDFGGSTTPTNHLFDRRGKIILENPRGLTEEDVFDQSIEAGATDIEVGEDGELIVFTEPDQTMAAAKALSSNAGATSAALQYRLAPEGRYDGGCS